MKTGCAVVSCERDLGERRVAMALQGCVKHRRPELCIQQVDFKAMGPMRPLQAKQGK